MGQKRFAEAAEQFSNTVYEQPDSLQPVIDKLKLDKRTATVQRTPAPGAEGAPASAKLLEAVFGNDAVRNKRNTDAVEIGPSQLASARIVEHTPAQTLALADVKDKVRDLVIAEQAAALARKDGQALLARLEKGDDLALPENGVVGRASAQGTPRAVVDAVLAADASKLPKLVGVDLGAMGYTVARITQILPRDPAIGSDEAMQTQYAQAIGNAEAQAYYAARKDRYKVEIKAAAAAGDPSQAGTSR
jgi:peptidyl-prolyl cis-trans isomerase D